MSRRRIARATMSVLALAAFLFTTTDARAERVPMGIAAQATNQATVVSVSAPVFLFPDATRVPLMQLKQGTAVSVLEVQDRWVQVEFSDSHLGNRVGFVEKKHLRLPVQAGATPDAARQPAPPAVDKPVPKGEATTAAHPQAKPPAKEVKPAESKPAQSTTPTVQAAKQSPGQKKAVATAKRKPPVIRNGFFDVSVGYQAVANDFTNAWQFTKNVESTTATVTYPVAAGVQFDVAGGVRLWRDLLVGAAVSSYNSNAAAHAVTAIPHPFYYAQMRQVEGDSASLTRSETAVHVDAMWVLAAARKLQLTLFGGPTLFQVSQPIVTNITYTESYPYDAATFGSTATEEQNASKIGFNAGADVSYMFTRQVGLGGGIRYSSATVPFRGPDGKTVSVKAGGPQVALGVRFRF